MVWIGFFVCCREEKEVYFIILLSFFSICGVCCYDIIYIIDGSSGCGKTLLARQIGQLLSKARPITVVSGPQLMDKFVGSSEKNLRELFDNPPGVYDP